MRRGSSTESASRFLRLYAERTGEEPHRPRSYPPKARWYREDVDAFREIVYGHIGHYPRSAKKIQRDVIDDYGSHTDRRFWRTLQFLVSSNLVERVEDGYRRVSKRRAGRHT